MAAGLGRVRWVLRRAWACADGPAFATCAALALWAGLALIVNLPLRHEIDALRSQWGSGAAAAVPRAVPPRWSERVDAFLAFLPPAELREQQMQTLHGLAGECGVLLSRVEYAHGALPELPVRRLSLQMSIVAGYAPYRKFLHSLLAGMPNLAIERIAMETSPEQPDRLVVRLDASLYYRQTGQPGRSGDASRR
ncbi:hypothetical protein GCM10023165_33330 [Variovorax defluvii]|uniref:Pilus assembly protein PilO n=1 Tax=Variovorax defluvii TaxID=913761 RepID=A0ABP8HZ31_9BURK